MVALLALVIACESASGATGTLRGRVIDEDGDSLPGIVISLVGAGDSARVLTDGEGGFRFSSLAPGSYRLVASFDGFYRVEYPLIPVDSGATIDLQIMMTFIAKEVECTYTVSESSFLGPGAVCSEFQEKWYTRALVSLEEPSLYDYSLDRVPVEAYRFLWLRSFHRPVAIRVEVEEGGTATVIAKTLSGEGGYELSDLEEVQKGQLSRQEVQEFRRLLERLQFWTTRTLSNRTGSDGAEWIIEAVKASEYHAVRERSPKTGAVRELGVWLLGLGMVEAEPLY